MSKKQNIIIDKDSIKKALLFTLEWFVGNLFQIFNVILIIGALIAFMKLLMYTTNIVDLNIRVLFLLVLLNTMVLVTNTLNRIIFHNNREWRNRKRN